MVNAPVVPTDGVVATQTGCANILTIDKIESENSVNSLLAFLLRNFLISKV